MYHPRGRIVNDLPSRSRHPHRQVHPPEICVVPEVLVNRSHIQQRPSSVGHVALDRVGHADAFGVVVSEKEIPEAGIPADRRQSVDQRAAGFEHHTRHADDFLIRIVANVCVDESRFKLNVVVHKEQDVARGLVYAATLRRGLTRMIHADISDGMLHRLKEVPRLVEVFLGLVDHQNFFVFIGFRQHLTDRRTQDLLATIGRNHHRYL